MVEKVVLVHVITGLHRLIGTYQPLFSLAQWLDRFLLTLITDLPWLLLAVLGVAVFLSLLGASFHLELTDLLGLEVAVLLLDWEGEDIRKLLAVSVHVSFADLHLDLSWDVIAALCGFPITHDTLWAITVVLGALIPLAVEFHGVSTGYIVDHLLLHVTVGGLHVGTLVVVLSGHIDLVCCVANPVLASEASLHLVSLL